MIEEKRFLGRLMVRPGVLDLLHHDSGKPLLRLCAFYAPGVAHCVKNHCLRLRALGIGSREYDVEGQVKVDVIRRWRLDERWTSSWWGHRGIEIAFRFAEETRVNT